MSSPSTSAEQVLVVSQSPCFGRRIERALTPLGYGVEHAEGAGPLGRLRRQRPYLVCFFDARGPDLAEGLAECVKVRPEERFVLVLGTWQQGGSNGTGPAGVEVFGYLREPFAQPEVLAWARRAADEVRLLKGDRSLEDLLYSRFRLFLKNLGPQPMVSLHDLVWERVERPLITVVLERTGGNQTRAAQVLGIHRNTLRAKIRSLGIDPSETDSSS